MIRPAPKSSWKVQVGNKISQSEMNETAKARSQCYLWSNHIKPGTVPGPVSETPVRCSFVLLLCNRQTHRYWIDQLLSVAERRCTRTSRVGIRISSKGLTKRSARPGRGRRRPDVTVSGSTRVKARWPALSSSWQRVANSRSTLAKRRLEVDMKSRNWTGQLRTGAEAAWIAWLNSLPVVMSLSICHLWKVRPPCLSWTHQTATTIITKAMIIAISRLVTRESLLCIQTFCRIMTGLHDYNTNCNKHSARATHNFKRAKHAGKVCSAMERTRTHMVESCGIVQNRGSSKAPEEATKTMTTY